MQNLYNQLDSSIPVCWVVIFVELFQRLDVFRVKGFDLFFGRVWALGDLYGRSNHHIDPSTVRHQAKQVVEHTSPVEEHCETSVQVN